MQVLARQVDALDVAGPAFECDGEAARLRLLDGVFGVDEPLLVERFAVALADYRQPSARGLTEPPRPAASTDLAFALYALRSELRRAAPGRHDSRFAQRDLGTAAEHDARE